MNYTLDVPDARDCPFCGHSAVRPVKIDNDFIVVCGACGSRGPRASVNRVSGKLESISMIEAEINAINLWNGAWKENKNV